MDTREKYFVNDNRLKLLSDGILRTEDGHVFHIHKFILAKHCKYFYALFCGLGVNKNDVMIPGIRGEVLSVILFHIYNGNIHLTEENICELMVASDYLLLDDILALVKTFLKRNITVENCLRIFMTTMKFHRDDISSECYRFVQTHFEKVVYNGNAELGELPLETLKLLLCDRNLCIRSERTAYFAIVKWTEADVANRFCWMPDLLMYMALSDVGEDLATEILEHHTVSSNPFCRDIAEIRSTCTGESSFEIIQKYLQGRPKMLIPFYNHRLPSKLNCIVRYTAIEGNDSFELYLTYDENIDLWRKIFEITMNPRILICSGDSIYLIRVKERRHFRYNIISNELNELSDFMIPRRNFAAVECEGYIYALGGISTFTGEEIYDVEVYDSDFDIWCYNAPMLPVSCFVAVSLNRRIYVVGYRSILDDYEMVAQVFETSSNTWRPLPAVSIGRSHFALVAYLEKIYVIGGIKEEEYLKDVEIFDPVKNEWKIGVSLPYIYYYPKATVLQNLLIVCDNHWEDRGYLKTSPPVFWNAREECWKNFDEPSPMNNLHLYDFLTVDEMESIKDITKENRHPDTVFERSPFE